MRRDAGLSLIEIVISLAIMGTILGGATMGLRAVAKSELRGTAGRLAGAIRYSYDRAISTGSFYRLHLDLDSQTYRLEHAEGRFVLTADKERAGRGGRGLDKDKEARRQQEEEQQKNSAQAGLPPELLPPPKPQQAKFEQFKDTALPVIKLKRIKVLDLYTPRQSEAYKAGQAYLYFFPDGHTERAVIHLGTDPADDDQYTLVVQPLTGRVEVRAGRYEPPSYNDTVDAAGAKKVDR